MAVTCSEVARLLGAIVGLGLNLVGLQTYNDLQDALSRRSMKQGVWNGRA